MLTVETVGRPMLGQGCEIRVHSVALIRGGSEIYSVAISRDGTLIMSGDSDGMVRGWGASTGEPSVNQWTVVRV